MAREALSAKRGSEAQISILGEGRRDPGHIPEAGPRQSLQGLKEMEYTHQVIPIGNLLRCLEGSQSSLN